MKPEAGDTVPPMIRELKPQLPRARVKSASQRDKIIMKSYIGLTLSTNIVTEFSSYTRISIRIWEY